MRKIDKKMDNPIDNVLLDWADLTLPFFRTMDLTANDITSFSFIFTLIGLYAFYYEHYALSAICIFTSYFFDCVDGHYSRSYDLVTTWGDWYDHGNDALRLFGILVLMYMKSKTKFMYICPVIVVFLILALIHLGCQERYYDQQQESSTLTPLRRLCFKKEYIAWTRYVGVGTLQTVVALSILLFY